MRTPICHSKSTPKRHYRESETTELRALKCGLFVLMVAGVVQGGMAQSAPQAVVNTASAQPAVTQGTPSPDNAAPDNSPADSTGSMASATATASRSTALSAPTPKPRAGLLGGIGERLNTWGITPVLNLTQMYLTNPTLGQETGKHEALTFITVGANFDLQKLLGIKGATIHFNQLYVPFTTNLSYGLQAGDSLVGQPAPYVPQVSHLVTFTWEQKAFNDRVDLEFGKSNAGAYFGAPVCNQGFGCQSPILQDNAGFNAPIYANWGARIAYNFTPSITAQVGAWRSNPAYPFTNGWEWSDKIKDSNTYLANLTYHTEYSSDPYPKHYEVMGFYNTANQVDPYYTSQTHKGTSGLYVGGRQVIYRPDGGKGGVFPTALSAFGSVTTSLDQQNGNGLQTTGNAGLTVEAPFRSRPHDSYSLKLSWVRLTQHEQDYLKAANLAAGGSGYTVGRDEFSLGIDANLVVTPSVVLSPFIARTWHTDAWGNPSYANTPRNGFAGGLLLTVFFDKMLGLTDQ